MENQREAQVGGSRRRPRRRSSRPAGAPQLEKSGAPATSAATKTQNLSRRPRPKKRKRPTTPQQPVDGAIVFERDGEAGKAPKRYTTSSSQNGPRPVTRHLTRKQAKRTTGRAYPETSAGGILLRHTRRAYNAKADRVYLSTVKVPIIGRTDRRGRMLWSLPKGHIEDYETVPVTAEREVLEETGIRGTAFKKLGTVDYWFLSDGKRIHKTVHHYLLKYESGELSDGDPEVAEVAWVSLPELPSRLSYADERKLARRATGVVSTWIRKEYARTSGADSPHTAGDGADSRNRRRKNRRGSRGRGRRRNNQPRTQQPSQQHKQQRIQQHKQQHSQQGGAAHA